MGFHPGSVALQENSFPLYQEKSPTKRDSIPGPSLFSGELFTTLAREKPHRQSGIRSRVRSSSWEKSLPLYPEKSPPHKAGFDPGSVALQENSLPLYQEKSPTDKAGFDLGSVAVEENSYHCTQRKAPQTKRDSIRGLPIFSREILTSLPREKPHRQSGIRSVVCQSSQEKSLHLYPEKSPTDKAGFDPWSIALLGRTLYHPSQRKVSQTKRDSIPGPQLFSGEILTSLPREKPPTQSGIRSRVRRSPGELPTTRLLRRRETIQLPKALRASYSAQFSSFIPTKANEVHGTYHSMSGETCTNE